MTTLFPDSVEPDSIEPGSSSRPAQIWAGSARAAIRAQLFGRHEPMPKIGRFVVDRLIGTGGMGSVFAARDETLQRTVAVKLLRPRLARSDREQLLPEARAMARLRHPNVVQIYEVGHEGDELYIAMEWIDGTTLDAWQRAETRSVDALLEAYVQAGRGLAAAHEAGFVHRDFKPRNAMVSTSAPGKLEVRVLDFGLAMPTGVRSSPASPLDTMASHPGDGSTAVGGTPAYMAPEQILGAEVDARADQFSLCVALWEALHGRHPFAAPTTQRLFARVVAGDREPATRTGLRRRVTAALVRGLDPDPERRFGSMAALLAELADEGAARRRRWGWLLSGGVGGGLLTGLVVANMTDPEGCRSASQWAEEQWGSQRRDEIRTALLATELGYAEPVWRSLSAGLDRYVSEWSQMHVEVCEQTGRHEQSEATQQLRLGCLRRAQNALQAVTDVLAGAESRPEVVSRTRALLGGLPPLQGCADVGALELEEAIVPEAVSAGTPEQRAALARADALLVGGRYEDAQAALEALQPAEPPTPELEPHEPGAPLRAEMALLQGRVFVALGRYEDAEPALRSALRGLLGLNRTAQAHAAAVALIDVVAGKLHRVAEGARYEDVALGLVQGEPRRRAATLAIQAMLARSGGEYGESLRLLDLSIAEVETLDDHRVAESLPLRLQRGETLRLLDRWDEAEQELESLLGPQTQGYGADHPDTNRLRTALGNVELARGDYHAAEARLREVLASQHRTLGDRHVQIATTRAALSIPLVAQGQFAEAEAELREALAIRERTLGSDHVDIARTLVPLADVLRRSNKIAEAESVARRALNVSRLGYGPDHVMVAAAQARVGQCLFLAARHADAMRFYEDALQTYAGLPNPPEVEIAQVRSGYGDVLSARGLHAEAIREHERVIATLLRYRAPDNVDVQFARSRLEAAQAAQKSESMR